MAARLKTFAEMLAANHPAHGRESDEEPMAMSLRADAPLSTPTSHDDVVAAHTHSQPHPHAYTHNGDVARTSGTPTTTGKRRARRSHEVADVNAPTLAGGLPWDADVAASADTHPHTHTHSHAHTSVDTHAAAEVVDLVASPSISSPLVVLSASPTGPASESRLPATSPSATWASQSPASTHTHVHTHTLSHTDGSASAAAASSCAEEVVDLTDGAACSGTTGSGPEGPANEKARARAELRTLVAQLSPEQKAAYEAVLVGENVFITGSAGTGKSLLLACIVRGLKLKHGDERVAVCASTGIAAEPLKGCTVHSWLGCQVGEYYKNFTQVAASQAAMARIHQTCALIVDEVSMISGEFLDALDDACTYTRVMMHPDAAGPAAVMMADPPRRKQRRMAVDPDLGVMHDCDGARRGSYGKWDLLDSACAGMQLILCGDFAQLPPVQRKPPTLPGRPPVVPVWRPAEWWQVFDQALKAARNSVAQLQQNLRDPELPAEFARLKASPWDEPEPVPSRMAQYLHLYKAGEPMRMVFTCGARGEGMRTFQGYRTSTSAPVRAGAAVLTTALDGVMTHRDREQGDYMFNLGFAFQSTSWLRAKFRICVLNKVFRQNDASFVHALQVMRRGVVSADVLDVLRPRMTFGTAPTARGGHSWPSPPPALLQSSTAGAAHAAGAAGATSDATLGAAVTGAVAPATTAGAVAAIAPDELTIMATELFATNVVRVVHPVTLAPLAVCVSGSFAHLQEVESLNIAELEKLPMPEHVYVAERIIQPEINEGRGAGPEQHRRSMLVQEQQVKALLGDRTLLDRSPVTMRLRLRIGAQVMLLRNLDQRAAHMLVNGSRGVIIALATAAEGYERLLVQYRQAVYTEGVNSEEASAIKRRIETYVAHAVAAETTFEALVEAHSADTLQALGTLQKRPEHLARVFEGLHAKFARDRGRSMKPGTSQDEPCPPASRIKQALPDEGSTKAALHSPGHTKSEDGATAPSAAAGVALQNSLPAQRLVYLSGRVDDGEPPQLQASNALRYADWFDPAWLAPENLERSVAAAQMVKVGWPEPDVVRGGARIGRHVRVPTDEFSIPLSRVTVVWSDQRRRLAEAAERAGMGTVAFPELPGAPGINTQEVDPRSATYPAALTSVRAAPPAVRVHDADGCTLDGGAEDAAPSVPDDAPPTQRDVITHEANTFTDRKLADLAHALLALPQEDIQRGIDEIVQRMDHRRAIEYARSFVGNNAETAATMAMATLLRDTKLIERVPAWMPEPGKLPWRRDPVTGEAMEYPVVRFKNGVHVITPMPFTVHSPGVGDVMVVQVPLRLAWALTIHKSQGMSLDAVRTNLSSVFADGQVYVALSRARNLEGLEIHGFRAAMVKTAPAVVHFHAMLEIAEQRRRAAQQHQAFRARAAASSQDSAARSSPS